MVCPVNVAYINPRIIKNLGTLRVILACLLAFALGSCAEEGPQTSPDRSTCPIECPFDCDPFTLECIGSDAVSDDTPLDDETGFDLADETAIDFGDQTHTDGVFDQLLDDGQVDPVEPPDDGVDPDDDVAPTEYCPDAREEHVVGEQNFADNNVMERATPLTDSLLLGELVACGENAIGACESSCDTSACNPESPNGCSCCDCHLEERLSACGNDDIDYYSFNLLKGDTATIRVIPEEDAEPRDLLVRLHNPDTSERPVVPSMDFPDVNVVVVGGADNVIGDPRIIVAYHLSVRSATGGTVPYRIISQIDSDSRGCPADPWDSPWDNYLEDVGSERECTHELCTVEHSYTSPAPARLDAAEGFLCPWDTTDVVRHVVDVDHTSREVQILWTSSMTRLTGILYRIPPSGTREEIGRLCESDSDEDCAGTTASTRSIKRRFDDLRAGTYQLVITGDNLTEARDYRVLFYQ